MQKNGKKAEPGGVNKKVRTKEERDIYLAVEKPCTYKTLSLFSSFYLRAVTHIETLGLGSFSRKLR